MNPFGMIGGLLNILNSGSSVAQSVMGLVESITSFGSSDFGA
ncbi:hypothetical protein [Nocardia albiluteola]|nr:hypothetical protein [Nocardia albiluteola]